jgi:septal ring factor EnvC (AmiA/AmiB activator)
MRSINRIKKAMRNINKKIIDIDKMLNNKSYQDSLLMCNKKKERNSLEEQNRLLEKVIPKIPRMTTEQINAVTNDIREHWL